MDIINRINSTRFLGREFLTWLWYKSDVNTGIFRTGRFITDEPVEVWFDKKIRLETGSDMKESSTIQAENPTETTEARASALSGKVVSDAALRIVRGQKQWSVTVAGDTLGLKGVKIPALLSREDDDQLYERFQLIEEVEQIILGLFNDFIALRAGDDWPAELKAIRQWVHR